MNIIKGIIYLMIFGTSTAIGFLLSQRYERRVEELKDFKGAFNMLKTKIRYTYLPLKDIFEDIEKSANGKVKEVFIQTCKNMNFKNPSNSWSNAVNNAELSITNEDKGTVCQLSKMLGMTDIDGQISQIDLTISFLDMQIEKAENEKQKNSKLYKTLGVITGMGIIIILL